MSIIAVLSMLSVSALVSARSQRFASGSADQLISDIRQTKAYALETQSITIDNAGVIVPCYPKMWALTIDSSSTTAPVIRSAYCQGLSAWVDASESASTGVLPRDFSTTMSLIKRAEDGSESALDTLNLIYNVPLGKFYAVAGGTLPDVINDNQKLESLKPSSGYTLGDDAYIITFTKGGSTQDVMISNLSGSITK